MNEHAVFDREVTVADMGAAREARAQRQRALLAEYRAPLVCLTMNIAGAVKVTPEIADAFAEALDLILRQLARHGARALHVETNEVFTGFEGYIAVDAKALTIKRWMAQIEDADAFGRLLDIDVLAPNGEKVSRADIGLPARACLLCGNEAALCARSRAHTSEALFCEATRILRERAQKQTADRIAELATRALLYEVAVTPKPGLVDLRNTGAHDDMDVFTFLSSAASLTPYFALCAREGMSGRAPDALFARIRYPGMLAEDDMLRATGGVNAHKGAIFTLGVLCCALGALADKPFDARAACLFCGDMTRAALASEKSAGARAEIAAGLPSVRDVALPALEGQLQAGRSLNDAAAYALIALLASVRDANVVRRSSEEKAALLREEARALLTRFSLEDARTLDDACIRDGVSPGGCADLLAAALLLRFMASEGRCDKRASFRGQAAQNPSYSG